jgi:hypothetical protein
VPYEALANAVLILHLAVVVFVVFSLPAVLVGNWRGWACVNNLWFRSAHVLTIGVVVLQGWLGQYCALTELESALRLRAGGAGYESSFIQYWVQRVLFYQAPLWVFAFAYTAFGALVAWAWWRFPPTRKHSQRSDA